MTPNTFFQKAENLQAFLKVGFLGFPKSGKTYTAALFACGLHKAIKSKKPIVFIDTETGSDWVLRLFKKDNIQLMVAKKRAFIDLLPMCQEASKISDILIIDSISSFWTDLMESYLKKKGRKRITFPDWNILKPTWRKFTDFFLTSPLHIFMLGRAGWEYNFFAQEDGSMELTKTGTRMKAESEIGYEPSILIEMVRERKNENAKTDKDLMGRGWVHTAYVIGDRSDVLDSKSFENPTFKDFVTILKQVNIGGKHFALDTERDSQEMFEAETGKPAWKLEQEKKEVELDEIQSTIVKVFPGQSTSEKRAKILLLELVFQCKGWKTVEALKWDQLKEGHRQLDTLLSHEGNIELLLSADPDLDKISWALRVKKEELIGKN